MAKVAERDFPDAFASARDVVARDMLRDAREMVHRMAM